LYRTLRSIAVDILRARPIEQPHQQLDLPPKYIPGDVDSITSALFQLSTRLAEQMQLLKEAFKQVHAAQLAAYQELTIYTTLIPSFLAKLEELERDRVDTFIQISDRLLEITRQVGFAKLFSEQQHGPDLSQFVDNIIDHIRPTHSLALTSPHHLIKAMNVDSIVEKTAQCFMDGATISALHVTFPMPEDTLNSYSNYFNSITLQNLQTNCKAYLGDQSRLPPLKRFLRSHLGPQIYNPITDGIKSPYPQTIPSTSTTAIPRFNSTLPHVGRLYKLVAPYDEQQWVKHQFLHVLEHQLLTSKSDSKEYKKALTYAEQLCNNPNVPINLLSTMFGSIYSDADRYDPFVAPNASLVIGVNSHDYHFSAPQNHKLSLQYHRRLKATYFDVPSDFQTRIKDITTGETRYPLLPLFLKNESVDINPSQIDPFDPQFYHGRSRYATSKALGSLGACPDISTIEDFVNPSNYIMVELAVAAGVTLEDSLSKWLTTLPDLSPAHAPNISLETFPTPIGRVRPTSALPRSLSYSRRPSTTSTQPITQPVNPRLNLSSLPVIHTQNPKFSASTESASPPPPTVSVCGKIAGSPVPFSPDENSTIFNSKPNHPVISVCGKIAASPVPPSPIQIDDNTAIFISKTPLSPTFSTIPAFTRELSARRLIRPDDNDPLWSNMPLKTYAMENPLQNLVTIPTHKTPPRGFVPINYLSPLNIWDSAGDSLAPILFNPKLSPCFRSCLQVAVAGENYNCWENCYSLRTIPWSFATYFNKNEETDKFEFVNNFNVQTQLPRNPFDEGQEIPRIWAHLKDKDCLLGPDSTPLQFTSSPPQDKWFRVQQNILSPHFDAGKPKSHPKAQFPLVPAFPAIPLWGEYGSSSLMFQMNQFDLFEAVFDHPPLPPPVIRGTQQQLDSKSLIDTSVLFPMINSTSGRSSKQNNTVLDQLFSRTQVKYVSPNAFIPIPRSAPRDVSPLWDKFYEVLKTDVFKLSPVAYVEKLSVLFHSFMTTHASHSINLPSSMTALHILMHLQLEEYSSWKKTRNKLLQAWSQTSGIAITDTNIFALALSTGVFGHVTWEESNNSSAAKSGIHNLVPPLKIWFPPNLLMVYEKELISLLNKNFNDLHFSLALRKYAHEQFSTLCREWHDIALNQNGMSI
jgi:hypothetical protein